MKTKCRNINLKFLSALFVLLLFACAKQGYPPGGPVDKRPPQIISTVPRMDSTNVDVNTLVEIEFSETVDRRTCEQSIFITPFPGEDINYKWKGNKLIIRLPGELAKDRTYVVTIGTGTKDLRNNPMKTSYSLAFSTGDVLDVAGIDGHVYGESVTGTKIWAYDLNENPTPNPGAQFPLYVTQAGEDGYYELTHLAYSSYRVFAVLDRNLNNIYDPGYDQIGTTYKDIELGPENINVYDMNLRVVLKDTIPPRLMSSTAFDVNHIDLRFSESLRPDSLDRPDNYIMFNPADTLGILEAWQDPQKPFMVHLLTVPQKPDTSYRFFIKNAWDLAGNRIVSDSIKVIAKTSAKPDTIQPRYVFMAPRDSSKNVIADKISIYFSKPMNKKSVEKHFCLADTSGSCVNGQFYWPHSSELIFSPDSLIKREMMYSVTLPVDSVKDFNGNTLADTLFVKKFTTINPDTLSEISGIISDMDTTATGPFYMTARPVKGEPSFIKVEKTGEYLFTKLMPGIYTLELFRDSDENGEYTHGNVWPFTPAERFYVYPDSITIRSRWPSVGEDILLPY